MNFFSRKATKKNSFFSRPCLEGLEIRLVPAGEFLLHSNPGATKRIFLDFDGHTTTGTQWNSDFNTATIITPAYDIDNNPSSFSATELDNIREIWERVSEDYLPFNVDVTTEDPGIEALRKVGSSDTEWGLRVAIGGTYNTVLPGSNPASGYCYKGFGLEYYGPAFVFPANAAGNPQGISCTISHESGHSLGLNHDGDPSKEYYPGHGTGVTSWAPLMGSYYGKNLTQWSKGEYTGANNQEDDLDIITKNNGFGYRNDDFGSTVATASNLNFSNSTTISTTGIIEKNTDLDYFRFNLAVGGTATININPAVNGPNLDIEAKLYNASGTLLLTDNPTNALNASFSTTLTAGTYYISIDGVGMGNPLTTGYTDYGSLGFYSITGTVPSATTPPVITGPTGGPGAATSTVTMNENISAVTTFFADKAVAWSVNGGLDQSKFTINTFTGALSFISAPDFENPTDSNGDNIYIVIVRATDTNGNISSQTLTVTVANVVELPPVITGPSGAAGALTSTKGINENTSTVFTFIADKTVTWSINGGLDQSRFSINAVTGALTFINNPDFENPSDSDLNNTYIVTIRATDSSGLAANQTLTVTILDVVETGTGTNRPDVTGAKVSSSSATGLDAGSITGFRIKFNESIRFNANPALSTFTTADITLTDPSGAAISGITISAVPNTNNTEFILNFSGGARTTAGIYTLKVGPNILDLSGNQMNQDNDGMNGEITQDQYVGSYSLFTTYTFTNTPTNTLIRDLATTTSTLTINQDINIKDLNVQISLNHTALSDLVITLRSPTGQVITLFNRRGAWENHLVNTVFDDDLANPTIGNATWPFIGSFRPESLLSVLNDKNAKGTWTLSITDTAGGDAGKLISWKLTMVSNTKLGSITNLASTSGGSITVTNPVASMAMFAPALANAIVNTPATTTTGTSTTTSSSGALPNNTTSPANSIAPIASTTNSTASSSSSARPTAQQTVADQLFSGLFRI
ncbi:MAG: Leupeptin-inactivating enzyme 1 precursor [Planctomycetota bacterium]|jgi:subtilisin-like proprotein convertase family protein